MSIKSTLAMLWRGGKGGKSSVSEKRRKEIEAAEAKIPTPVKASYGTTAVLEGVGGARSEVEKMRTKVPEGGMSFAAVLKRAKEQQAKIDEEKKKNKGKSK